VTVLHSDETLVVLLSKGDQEAFTDIYRRFYERVLHFARKYVIEEDALDITAETFAQLWRRRESFSDFNSLCSFLFVIARNRCYDTIRHQNVKYRYKQELISMQHIQEAEGFYLEQVRVELGKIIALEINRLPDRMREIFTLSFEEGLKPAQIASQLNISVKTVSNQKLSAIKILKGALRQHSLEVSLFFAIQSEIAKLG